MASYVDYNDKALLLKIKTDLIKWIRSKPGQCFRIDRLIPALYEDGEIDLAQVLTFITTQVNSEHIRRILGDTEIEIGVENAIETDVENAIETDVENDIE